MKALNIQNRGIASQAGFTIIELIVVILLLGILTATALPRFIDVSDEAHNAVVDAVASGLNTSYALYRAEFIAENDNDATVGSSGVPASVATGYPDHTNNAACVTILDSLLQAGHPGVVAGDSTPATVGAVTSDLSGETNFGSEDFLAFGTTDANCVWVYTADVVSSAAATGAKVITMTSGGLIGRSTL